MEVWDYERARTYLLGIERPERERRDLRQWVDWNVPRFLRTLELVPPGSAAQRCLEVGSMPYTFTLLLKKLRPYELVLVDYFSGAPRAPVVEETVRLPAFGEEHCFASFLCDLERQPLPLDDCALDGALCCEVLEHLTQDPVAMLVEIHRALRPNGWLVLTTPNVARWRNAFNLLHGRNVYDPYELAFGPTWRHNREYTAREVADLLTETGFVVEQVLVEDPDPPFHRRSLAERLTRRVAEWIYRQNYGAQIYVRARRGEVARRSYPGWLFQHQEMRREPAAEAVHERAVHG
jgi:SAM-dependent methyltransferase